MQLEYVQRMNPNTIIYPAAVANLPGKEVDVKILDNSYKAIITDAAVIDDGHAYRVTMELNIDEQRSEVGTIFGPTDSLS